MNVTKIFETTDVHVSGEIFRFFTDPLIKFTSSDVVVKQEELIKSKQSNYILLSNEPRGHRGVNTCLIERSELADFQLLFLPHKHANVFNLEALAASLTYLIEFGKVELKKTYSIETYLGIYQLAVDYKNGKVNHVQYTIDTSNIKREEETFSIHGAKYRLIQKPQEINCLNVSELSEINRYYKTLIDKAYFESTDYVVLYEHLTEKEVTTVIFERDGHIIRSPKIELTAILKNLLGKSIVNRTIFDAAMVFESESSINVEAFVLATSMFVFDDEDPLKKGFLLQ